MLDSHSYLPASRHPDDSAMGFKMQKTTPIRQGKDVRRLAEELTHGIESDEKKARVIYDWMHGKLDYGWSGMLEGPFFCRNSTQVLDTMQGVCIEQAVLCTALARSAGLNAKIGILTDADGKVNDHTLCVVETKENDPETGKRKILPVDPMGSAFGRIYDLDRGGKVKAVDDKYVIDNVYRPWFETAKSAVKNPDLLKVMLDFPLYSRPYDKSSSGKQQASAIKIDASKFAETGKVDAVYGVYLNDVLDSNGPGGAQYKHLHRVLVTRGYDLLGGKKPKPVGDEYRANVKYLGTDGTWQELETKAENYQELKGWIEKNPAVKFEKSEKKALYDVMENKSSELYRVLNFARKHFECGNVRVKG